MENDTERTPLKDLANNFNCNTENYAKCESGGKIEESRPGKRMSLLELLDPLYDPKFESNLCEDTLLEVEVIETPKTIQPVQESSGKILDVTCEIEEQPNQESEQVQLDVIDELNISSNIKEETTNLVENCELIVPSDNSNEHEIQGEQKIEQSPVNINPIEIAELKIQINNLQIERNALQQTLEEYERSFASKLLELQNVVNESEIAKRHLSSLEIAFSDLLQKYERSKTIIVGYQTNEATFKEHLKKLEDTLKSNQEKYEGLKTYVTTELTIASEEIRKQRASHEADVAKYTTLIKRLEIKNESLLHSLDQKTKECSSLTALIEEIQPNK